MAAVVPEGSPVETPAVQEYRRQWLALPTWLLRVARSLAVALRLRYGSPGFRFLMLAFTVFIVFSGYFSYDLPGITSEDLKKEPVSLTNVELGLLFSVYAFPNAFLPLFSGMFFTVLGVWKGVLIIGVVIGCGIAIIAAGVAAQSFWLMLLGRAVYGLGGESLMVGVDVLVTNWFKDKEIGLAYGLLQAAGQAGSFAAFYGIPMLLKEGHYGYVTAYYVGLLFAVVAVACLFMGHALEQVSIAPSVAVLGDELSASDAGLPPEQAGAVQQLEKALSHEHAAADLSSPDAKHAASRTGGGGGALHRKKRWFSCSLTSPLAVAVGLNHLVGLQVDFWLVIVGIAAYSGSFYTFMGEGREGGRGVCVRWRIRREVDSITGGTCTPVTPPPFEPAAFGMDYLESKYGLDMEDSGRIIGIISIASCGLSPLSGFLLDKRGGRPYAAFVGMAGSCAAFALLGFTNAPVMPTVVFAGVCYSVLPAALYPLVADVVPEEAFTQVRDSRGRGA